MFIHGLLLGEFTHPASSTCSALSSFSACWNSSQSHLYTPQPQQATYRAKPPIINKQSIWEPFIWRVPLLVSRDTENDWGLVPECNKFSWFNVRTKNHNPMRWDSNRSLNAGRVQKRELLGQMGWGRLHKDKEFWVWPEGWVMFDRQRSGQRLSAAVLETWTSEISMAGG